MSELETFRDHCRKMADAGHSPDCAFATGKALDRWGHFHLFREWPEKWGARPSGPPKPCPGDCVSDADRALFTRLADEIDAYLTPDADEPLWGAS